MPARRGPFRLTKKEVKQKYAAKRRVAYLEYVQRNGDGTGWRSSDEKSRIDRNEQQALYRREKKRNRIKAEKAQRELEEAIKKGKPVGQLGISIIKIIAVDEFFWTALNRRGGAEGSIMDTYDELEKDPAYPSPILSRVRDFDGRTYNYQSRLGLELRIQSMYTDASAEQNEAKKNGVSGTSGMHTVTATAVQLPDGRALITVEANRL